MTSSFLIYFGFLDGTNRHTQNITYVAWFIYHYGELVNSWGICLGSVTNNVVEYHVIIEILTKASTLGIRHLIVCLDFELVISKLNLTYSIWHPILFWKYLRVRLLERLFHFISYEHIPRQFNSLADSLENFVLNWHLLH